MINELASAITGLPSETFWLLLGLSNALALTCLYLSFRYYWRYRMMLDMPTASIRSAAQGYSELEGVARLLPGEPIIAPLTRLSCVWYRYKVEQKQTISAGKSSRTTWILCESGISDGVFSLQGKTGKAIVDPDDAEVIYSAADTWYGNSRSPRSGPRGFTSSRLSIGKRYRYTEKRIHEDDFLYILGHFSSLRESLDIPKHVHLAALLKSWKKNPAKMLRNFDKNRDHQIDAAEWEQAVIFAKKQLASEAQSHQKKQVDHLISKTKDSRKPFLISTKKQAVLIRHFQYKSWGALSLFFILGVIAVWMFNIRFEQ